MLAQVAAAVLAIASVAMPMWIVIRLAMRAFGGAERVSLVREGVQLVAVGYVVTLLAVTVYPLPVARHHGPMSGLNVKPMVAALRCLSSVSAGPPRMRLFCLDNIVGNILLFIPVGVLVPLLGRRHISLGRVALIALLLSVSIEAAQYGERRFGLFRAVDIDDIIYNVAGAVLGYFLLMLVSGAMRRSQPRTT